MPGAEQWQLYRVSTACFISHEIMEGGTGEKPLEVKVTCE